MKNVLTYSALNTFRNCPCKYKNRYMDGLTPRERAETLAFGTAIHSGLEFWHRQPASDPLHVDKLLDFVDSLFPIRQGDPAQKRLWQNARAMLVSYADRYSIEEFEVVELEKEFQADIRNPDTGRGSQTFTMAGKVDGIVRIKNELYLLENKTASVIDSNYLDKLWTDTQIALYSFFLREVGYPIVGVVYNILLKSRLQQKSGETDAEYQARLLELSAKNKSGKSNAKRQEPESDEAFMARLLDWYAKPESFHRERIFLSEDRLSMLQDEVWEVTQQFLDARRRDKWLMNTSYCFAWSRPCEYLPYCQSAFNPNIRDNLFDIKPPHEELAEVIAGSDPSLAF